MKYDIDRCFGEKFLQLEECIECKVKMSCRRLYQVKYGRSWKKKRKVEVPWFN